MATPLILCTKCLWMNLQNNQGGDGSQFPLCTKLHVQQKRYFLQGNKEGSLLLQGNKLWFDDIQTSSSFATSINNDPHCYTIKTISSCAFLQNLFSINSVQMGLYTETGMAMMALREAPLLTYSENRLSKYFIIGKLPTQSTLSSSSELLLFRISFSRYWIRLR